MQFGITIVGETIDNFIRYVRQADDMGVDAIGCGDSQALYHEQFIRCALAAEHTRRARVGTWITNPLTRHPAVTAAAIATVDDISKGRAFLGVGTGDSTVYNAGLRPASLETLERFVNTVRELHQKGESTWHDRPAYLTWAKRRIPIGMAPSGPKGLRMAGRMADIVWVAFGLQPEEIELAREYLHEGAREAGRKLEDIELWWIAIPNVRESREAAVDELKFALASYGHIIFRYGLEGKAVPPHLSDRIMALAAGYQSRFHIAPGGLNPNAQLVERLDLTDYLANRLAITGTVDQWMERLSELRRHGVERIWFPLRVADKGPVMDAIRQIIARTISPLFHT